MATLSLKNPLLALEQRFWFHAILNASRCKMREFFNINIQIPYFTVGITMAIESARMKLKLFVILGILSFATCLRAQQAYSASNPESQMARPMTEYSSRLGIGVQFGEPFGLTGKYWLNNITALDLAAGWSPQDHSAAEIHADFLYHDFDLLSAPGGSLPVYFGGGIVGRFRNEGRGNLGGFRFPIGVSYMPDSCPVDVFAEVAPEVFFAPFVRGGITGAVGVRFWF